MLLPVFNPPVIGHRGASAYAPENTMASFIKAVQLGIHWVEFDVMQSADHQLIIFHDDSLDRTTNGHGYVNQYPYSYLQSLDAGKWFNPRFSNERIPLFTTVIDFLHENHIFANIEIKPQENEQNQQSPQNPQKAQKKLVKDMINIIQPYLLTHNHHYLFSSFSIDTLYFLRKYAPNCFIGLLLDEWVPGWEQICQELNCVSVHVNQEILTKKSADKIKSMGKALLAYTVNSASRAQELYAWGVDAVFSDQPDKVR